jgi:hypothetical protein
VQLKPILKWQYEQLIKELLLLQEHQSDPSCPCGTDGEMCVRKHLLAIEAYAEETLPIEDDETYRQRLRQLADEAKTYREREEAALCGHAEDRPDMIEWPRKWRKEFENYSLACENIVDSADKSCPAPDQ